MLPSYEEEQQIQHKVFNALLGVESFPCSLKRNELVYLLTELFLVDLLVHSNSTSYIKYACLVELLKQKSSSLTAERQSLVISQCLDQGLHALNADWA